ncbi:hypothetical protein CLOSTMETH_02249 [[Clostridium] methylpentosum DSM 5476]|uniref:Uncharacterized protein n=1 Tax=[Clostridium] methylpentosum DSM 5476 TaxID=537013 RepID=C0EEG3_9FIRM|nr:hypothetical protein CLOSTMETH_02249 [[Clostridium] methylpentosum DSM 5476]
MIDTFRQIQLNFLFPKGISRKKTAKQTSLFCCAPGIHQIIPSSWPNNSLKTPFALHSS